MRQVDWSWEALRFHLQEGPHSVRTVSQSECENHLMMKKLLENSKFDTSPWDLKIPLQKIHNDS